MTGGSRLSVRERGPTGWKAAAHVGPLLASLLRARGEERGGRWAGPFIIFFVLCPFLFLFSFSLFFLSHFFYIFCFIIPNEMSQNSKFIILQIQSHCTISKWFSTFLNFQTSYSKDFINAFLFQINGK